MYDSYSDQYLEKIFIEKAIFYKYLNESCLFVCPKDDYYFDMLNYARNNNNNYRISYNKNSNDYTVIL